MPVIQSETNIYEVNLELAVGYPDPGKKGIKKLIELDMNRMGLVGIVTKVEESYNTIKDFDYFIIIKFLHEEDAAAFKLRWEQKT